MCVGGGGVMNPTHARQQATGRGTTHISGSERSHAKADYGFSIHAADPFVPDGDDALRRSTTIALGRTAVAAFSLLHTVFRRPNDPRYVRLQLSRICLNISRVVEDFAGRVGTIHPSSSHYCERG